MFQGRRYDTESGLYYFRNRYYLSDEDVSPVLKNITLRSTWEEWGELSTPENLGTEQIVELKTKFVKYFGIPVEK